MNSPAPFASAMMAAIIIMLNTQHKLRWFAAPPVLISLLLSIVRTAWGGLGVALLYTIVRLRISATVRQLLVGRLRSYCGAAPLGHRVRLEHRQ